MRALVLLKKVGDLEGTRYGHSRSNMCKRRNRGSVDGRERHGSEDPKRHEEAVIMIESTLKYNEQSVVEEANTSVTTR